MILYVLLNFGIFSLILNRIYCFTLLFIDLLPRTQSNPSVLNQISHCQFEITTLQFSLPASKKVEGPVLSAASTYPTASCNTEPQITNGRGQLSLLWESGWVNSHSESGYVCGTDRSITPNEPNSWMPVPAYKPRGQDLLFQSLDTSFFESLLLQFSLCIFSLSHQ